MNTAPGGVGSNLVLCAVVPAPSAVFGPLPSAKPAVPLVEPQVCSGKLLALAIKAAREAGTAAFRQAARPIEAPLWPKVSVVSPAHRPPRFICCPSQRASVCSALWPGAVTASSHPADYRS
jgi:hypothetical protein